VLILKEDKVICFDTVLQVLILKGLEVNIILWKDWCFEERWQVERCQVACWEDRKESGEWTLREILSSQGKPFEKSPQGKRVPQGLG
jgi:hypothetical protein